MYKGHILKPNFIILLDITSSHIYTENKLQNKVVRQDRIYVFCDTPELRPNSNPALSLSHRVSCATLTHACAVNSRLESLGVLAAVGNLL